MRTLRFYFWAQRDAETFYSEVYKLMSLAADPIKLGRCYKSVVWSVEVTSTIDFASLATECGSHTATEIVGRKAP